MEAMYDAIHQALRAVDSDRTPTDYLQFMCLGKREEGPQIGPADVKGKAAAGVLSHRWAVGQLYMSLPDRVVVAFRSTRA